MERNPGAGDSRGSRAPVSLEHVAVDRDLPLTELCEVDHRTQRAADQPLNFLRAAGLISHRALAPGPFAGGARQHAILGRHPAPALVLQPLGHTLLKARRAQDMCVPKLDEAGALRMDGHATLEGDATKLVRIAF